MITVAVSGINAVDNPGPGVGIIRALKESALDVRTIGLAYDSMEPGIYLDHLVDKSYIMPYPSGDVISFMNRIQHIHSIEKLDVIISTLDAELPMYMDIESKLLADNIRMLIPTKKMFNLRNKSKLEDISKAIDILTPKYITCSSYGDLVKATQEIGFPCMIKGPFYEAFKANSPGEADSYFNKLAEKWGFPIIAQKFVKGQEYDVIGCGDGTGNNMGLFAIKKMTTTALGKVWNAVSINNDRLLDTCNRLLEHLEWRGGFELEVLIEENTDDIYLLEINPRFPAWVYMSAACGINLPERMVRFLLDMDHETHSNYASGKIMIRYTNEILKDISDFEQISSYGELENKKRLI
ncbi:MAG: ATP-grasp domain-containing protein [Candidatus Magnetomorum sp.]|nr:ATP-grasp domain-containing protein [Candidatus Magnetomorum sp.]